MVYDNVISGVFLSRPNRFIAYVKINGMIETAHVKNTGRCKELFTPNAEIYLQVSNNPNRKTKYDVIAVKKGNRIINIDSQITNAVFWEFAKAGGFITDIAYIKPECKFKNSRFDFYIESGAEKIFAEIKGVTLEENGIVRFPDAPTSRGVKHLNELIDAVKCGYSAYIIFVVQMNNVVYFEPNRNTHAEFADTLLRAKEFGVNVLAYDCNVSETNISINAEIPIIL